MPPVDENDVSPDERTPEQLDSIADNLDTPRNSPERPMSAPAEKNNAPDVKEETTYEFTHNGRPVKATKEQLIKWAQQGYDYPQKTQKLNQEKQAWEQQRQDWEKKWGTYRQIDEFATKNQDWWNFIQQQWQARGQQPPAGAGGAPGAAPQGFDPNRLKEELETKLMSTIDEKFFQPIRQQEEDAQLDNEIKSIRDKHANLDWNSLDENGKHLEMRILEHAQANGIQSFRVAMRDLLHDELVSKAEAQGKIAVSKGIQTRTKLGVLGESPTPTRGVPTSNKPIRNQTYESIMDEIRDELKSGVHR